MEVAAGAADAGYPWLGLLWTMLILVVVSWFWLLYILLGDLFTRRDLSRWAKVVWSAVLVVFPFLGVLAYLATRGRGVGRRRRNEAR